MAYLDVRAEPNWRKGDRRARSPYLLGCDDLNLDTDLLALLWRTARGKRGWGNEAAEQLSFWLVEAEGTGASVGYGLECLAWCRAMPQLAKYAPGKMWWNLLWHLLDGADEAAAAQAADPLAAMLLAAELPLTLAAQFPEIEDCRGRAEPALMAFQRLMTDPGMNEAMASPALLHLLRPTLACWIRCEKLSRRTNFRNRGQADKKARREAGRDRRRALRRLTLATMRWTGSDGQQILPAISLTDSQSNPANSGVEELLAAAVKLVQTRDMRKAWREFRARRSGPIKRRQRFPCPGAPYEASSTAVLRSDWSRRAAILATTFDGWPSTLEVSVGPQKLIRGGWEAEIRVAGQAVLPPARPWDIVCWESNRKEQWLELETEFEDGTRLERGLLLAPQDQVMLLMDVVVGAPGQEIEYVARLPLAPNVEVKKERETREVALRGEDGSARVLPLALGEWKTDPRHGEFSAGHSGLELRQQSREGALCAALWIDYSLQRKKQPLTWRHLAVGEERRAVSRDAAVGYRVQVGLEQWLVYRALRSRGNRTILGQNLATEFKVGRFLADGDVKTIVEIE